MKAADELIVRFREQHMQLKESELAKALTRLEKGEDPTTVVNQLANQLTNKMIHTPSVQLKNAVAEGEEELLKAITRLYELEKNR